MYDRYRVAQGIYRQKDGKRYSDSVIKKLWGDFADIPMNPETEQMDAPFLNFPVGTPREDIWHWFDERYSGGVYELLYGQ